MSAGLVIAGGGLAAQRCCEVLRAAGDDRPVTILAAEPTRALRPAAAVEARRSLASDLDAHFRPAAWYAEQRDRAAARASGAGARCRPAARSSRPAASACPTTTC